MSRRADAYAFFALFVLFIASLKDAIVARGGPTALQAVLNDSMSIESAIAAQLQRPSSSTMRIREYAPKAIKALGFAPIMPPGAPSIQ